MAKKGTTAYYREIAYKAMNVEADMEKARKYYKKAMDVYPKDLLKKSPMHQADYNNLKNLIKGL